MGQTYLSPGSSESEISPSLNVELADAPRPVLSTEGYVRIIPGMGRSASLTWSQPPQPFCEDSPSAGFPDLSLPVRSPHETTWGQLSVRVRDLDIDQNIPVDIGSDGQFVRIYPALSTLSHFRRNLCQSPSQAGISKDLSTQINGWLELAAPDCHFEAIAGEGWVCQLRETGPALASEELRQMSQQILRKWTRQPYVFSRRIAMTQQLAALLNKPFQADHYSRFCSLLSWSLPRELPMVMQLKTWQNAFCAHHSESPEYLGQVALNLALRELNFLKKLADINSYTTSLLIRVPSRELKSRELKIHLEPSPDVANELLQQAATIRSMNATPEVRTMKKHLFWHPLFSDQDEVLRPLAWSLSLTSDSDTLTTEWTGTTRQLVSDYLFESLTGEADFVVSNGRYKVLRLPQGQYHYRVYELNDSAQSWDPEPKGLRMSQGSITWRKSSSKPSIETW